MNHNDDGLGNPRKVKRLFYDLETSPNIGFFWRTGFKLNINPEAIIKERQIICIGWKWEGENKVHVISWDKNCDDKKMLKEFLAVAEQADELCAHFGDSFDMPWFRGRCIIQGLDPLPLFKTIDTKAIAGKYFYFNSNKLDYLASLFGYGHKEDTDWDMWVDITMKKPGWERQLKKMMHYCGKDVALLEKVWAKLCHATPPKSHAGVMAGHGRWTCPQTGSTNVRRKKRVVTPMGIIQHQMYCMDSKVYYKVSDLVFRQFLEAKKKQHERPRNSKKA